MLWENPHFVLTMILIHWIQVSQLGSAEVQNLFKVIVSSEARIRTQVSSSQGWFHLQGSGLSTCVNSSAQACPYLVGLVGVLHAPYEHFCCGQGPQLGRVSGHQPPVVFLSLLGSWCHSLWGGLLICTLLLWDHWVLGASCKVSLRAGTSSSLGVEGRCLCL